MRLDRSTITPKSEMKGTRRRLSCAGLIQVLSGAYHIITRSALTLIFAYFAFHILQSLKEDVKEQYEADIFKQHVKRDQCEDQYYENHCEPHERVEALEDFCEEKEMCMNELIQAGVKRITAFTGLISQAINTFAEGLGHKAFILTSLLIVSTVYYFSTAKPV